MRNTILTLALLAMLGTACSSDDTVDTAAADTSADVEADAGADVEADAGADVAVDASGVAERCTEIADAFTAVPASLGGTADAADVRAQAEAFAEVAADVPDEYSADFILYADYFVEIADALESGDPAALGSLATTASSADFATASTNLGTFFANGCQ